MSGADSPEILAAYDAVRSNTDPTNWLLISYASAVGDKLQLTKTGSGGLEELKNELDESQAQYAYLRIEYANDTEVNFQASKWGTAVFSNVLKWDAEHQSFAKMSLIPKSILKLNAFSPLGAIITD